MVEVAEGLRGKLPIGKGRGEPEWAGLVLKLQMWAAEVAWVQPGVLLC